MKKINIIPFLLGFLAIALIPARSQAQIITTIAGVGLGDDSLATRAEVLYAEAVAKDNAGNIYIGDNSSNRLRKVSSSGVITTIAGNGTSGYSGDGGPATAAALSIIAGIALDHAGNIYLADVYNNAIRKINTSGIITTIAGGNTTGNYSGDGGPATAAELNTPTDVIADTSGNIIFPDANNVRVRKINTAGIITTIAGDGSPGTTGDGGPATASELGVPYKVALDNKGNLFIAELDTNFICKVDTGGIIHVIGGTNSFHRGTDGDGGPATAATMTYPYGLAADTSGHVYFSDVYNSRIRVINTNTGIISNFAATGIFGYGGDGGPASAAQLSFPQGLYFDLSSGSLLISDGPNNVIREVNSSGIVSSIAGQCGRYDEGYPATNAEICTPANIATDVAGNVYIADYDNHRIQEINTSTGVITTVAGNGVPGYGAAMIGDGGPATNAHLFFPNSMTVDNAGNMYIIDLGNNRIRKVSTAGIITTFAGTDTAGYNADNIPATNAWLNSPSGIAVDNAGNVYIADQRNQRIRKVDNAGIITTFAGTGAATFSGDGGPATAAALQYPADVASDGKGNIFIADIANDRIRKVDGSGIITTVAGNGITGFSGDGGPATSARIFYPNGLKADSLGNIYIVDGNNQRIRIVNSAGIINSVAGNGIAGFSGDGGPATSAMLNGPSGVAFDYNGNVYIADGSNFRVRKVHIPNVSVPGVNRSLENIYVYPNPSHNQLNIEIPDNSAGTQITLFDVIGNVVYQAPMFANKQTVDMQHLASGVYMLQVRNNTGEKKIVKVVKE